MNKLFKSDQWTSRPLVEVATLQRGYDLPVQDRNAGPFPIFAANGPVGFHDTAKCEGPGVVTGRSGTIGKVQFVEGNYWPLNTSLYVTDFHGNHPKWVYYMLQSFGLEKYAQGAGVPTLNRNLVHHEPVLVPPLEEQRRIAAILDQAETLRTQRRTALALLDSLTQSLFLDMFGDPVANPKGWQRLPLSALVEKIDSGWSPVCLDRRAEEGEWAVLKLGAITSCEFKPQENKALPPDIAPVESIEVKPGDLLFSRKNTYELVAACALVNQTPARLMMSDLIFRFRLNASSAVIPQYLHRLLTYATKRQEVQKLAGGSAGSMPNISKAKLLDFLIEVPPLPLQKTFATRIASIEALKTTHRHALAALDALFASLQQRAFTGAL